MHRFKHTPMTMTFALACVSTLSFACVEEDEVFTDDELAEVISNELDDAVSVDAPPLVSEEEIAEADQPGEDVRARFPGEDIDDLMSPEGDMSTKSAVCDQLCDWEYDQCLEQTSYNTDICNPQYNQCLTQCNSDPDGDGLLDIVDNCDNVYNPNQADCDGDNKGDACDNLNGTQTLTNTSRQYLSYVDYGDFCDTITHRTWDRINEVHKVTRTYYRNYCDGTPNQNVQTVQNESVPCDVEQVFSQSCGWPFQTAFRSSQCLVWF